VARGGESPFRIVMELQSEPNLPKIVLALRATRRFARGLNRRQDQGDEDADDRNDDQQLDEGERSAAMGSIGHLGRRRRREAGGERQDCFARSNF
jgi:hypothetical protein